MNKRTPALLAGLFCAPAVMAASITDISVTGMITPSACTPTLSGGGVIDHGKMAARDLDPDNHTQLPRQSVHMTVRCEGVTLFALDTVDNRAGSSAVHEDWHGLGMVNDEEKLGSVFVGIYNAIADGEPAKSIVSTDGGVTWNPSTYLGHAGLTAIALANDSLVPVAMKELEAELQFYTSIARASDLTLTDEVPMDGHVTVQMNYL